MNTKKLVNDVIRCINRSTKSTLMLDESTIRNSVITIVGNAIHSGKRKDKMFVVISPELDMVTINIPSSQRVTNAEDKTVISITVGCHNIITMRAPELPCVDGIYRARMKDGSCGYVAYCDGFLITIPMYYRHNIRIRDPFWITLNSLKYDEYQHVSKTLTKSLMDRNTSLIKENKGLKMQLDLNRKQLAHCQRLLFNKHNEFGGRHNG